MRRLRLGGGRLLPQARPARKRVGMGYFAGARWYASPSVARKIASRLAEVEVVEAAGDPLGFRGTRKIVLAVGI